MADRQAFVTAPGYNQDINMGKHAVELHQKTSVLGIS